MVFNPSLVKHSSELALRRSLKRVLESGVNADIFNGTVPTDYKEYPTLVIGESTNGVEFVTKGNEGEELIITFHIYTEEEGYDQLDQLTEETLVALSGLPMAPNMLDSHWMIVKASIEAGSRKWHYAEDKAQKILYVRFSCDYY
jgi:hypothetical protein